MEQLIVCKTEDGRFAVRPVSWAGIWGKNGLLTNECNSLAYFEEEKDAKDYIAYRTLGPVEELSALVKAREEGRVVVLPCKTGDAVYSLRWNIKTEQYDVRSGEVKNVRYDSIDDAVTVSDGEYLRVLGKTAFLTPAEAEAALGGGGDG